MSSLSILATYDELIRCSNVLINGCEGGIVSAEHDGFILRDLFQDKFQSLTRAANAGRLTASTFQFLQFAVNQEEMRQKWLMSVQECQRLHSALEKAHKESSVIEKMFNHAKRLLEEEKLKRRTAEDQKTSLERQIALVRDLLFNDGGRNLNNETREKLQFLNTSPNGRYNNTHGKEYYPNDKLNTITELDSTASILSDLSSYSKSEDDLDTSTVLQQRSQKREWREHRPSGEYYSKKRRSSVHKVIDQNNCDRIVATTTVSVPKDGTISASSIIETIPGEENDNPQILVHNLRKKRNSGERKSKSTPIGNNLLADNIIKPTAPLEEIITSGSDEMFKPSPNIAGYLLNSRTTRGHNFNAKTVIKSEMCTFCSKRIRFGKVAMKCRDCRGTTHPECKDFLPLPCVPTGNTPTMRGVTGTIADYTPMIPPMVPALVVHCINEIELRGMNEQGLYRVNGGSNEVKNLKEKFLKGKGAPDLSHVDIPTICSTLKDFLRSLKEPLITVGLWADFGRAVALSDKEDADAALYQAISELPQPNRDTLAFLILHLQRVSSSFECKMPISNLAKVFGPTLVGYSCQEPTVTSMLSETKDQAAIVESLLNVPSDYWANFVNPEICHENRTPQVEQLRHTPSTESILKSTAPRGFFHTPLGTSRSFLRKNKKFLVKTPSGADL